MMFSDPGPAEKLAMTSTNERAGEWNWLTSVVNALDSMAHRYIGGEEAFFAEAGADELRIAEERADERHPVVFRTREEKIAVGLIDEDDEDDETDDDDDL